MKHGRIIRRDIELQTTFSSLRRETDRSKKRNWGPSAIWMSSTYFPSPALYSYKHKKIQIIFDLTLFDKPCIYTWSSNLRTVGEIIASSASIMLDFSLEILLWWTHLHFMLYSPICFQLTLRSWRALKTAVMMSLGRAWDCQHRKNKT